MKESQELIASLKAILNPPEPLKQKIESHGEDAILLDTSSCMLAADTYKQQGQFDEALKWYEHVCNSVNTSYPSAYTNQALCLWLLNQREKALGVLNYSLAFIDFAPGRYSRVELLNFFKVYCLCKLKYDNPRGSVNACFTLLDYILEGITKERASGKDYHHETLLDQCQALSELKGAEPNPIPINSASILLASVDTFAKSSTGKLIVTRPGNVEMVAVLCNRFTYELGNNAGIYDEPIFRGNNESFCLWRDLYIKAMNDSSHIMIANFFDNYAGPALYKLNLRDKSVNCPSDLDFYCQLVSKLLDTKKVLCISPFAKTMISQASCIELVHDKRYAFNAANLRFYRCKQSISFSSQEPWLKSFESMKEDLDMIDFDIALVSAGGYGHPIISYLADKGKSAFYFGGILQAVFGILGKRYEGQYSNLINSYWVRPSHAERPEGFQAVENGCYW